LGAAPGQGRGGLAWREKGRAVKIQGERDGRLKAKNQVHQFAKRSTSDPRGDGWMREMDITEGGRREMREESKIGTT